MICSLRGQNLRPSAEQLKRKSEVFLPKSALVIGFGSIGQRHARILGELGCRVGVVSRRSVSHPRAYRDTTAAIEAMRPEYIVIANSTEQHYGAMTMLSAIGYVGTVLIEKPLFHRSIPLPTHSFERLFVAYNLRFHPLIQRLKALLADQSVLTIQSYVGQYLPAWRPDVDFRTSYSAQLSRGGGVLRDLSHELDYLMWMTGPWSRVCALGGHLSQLEIDSDDVFALLLQTAECPIVTLQMNYLDRKTRRSIIVNTVNHTIEVDLVEGSMTVDREKTVYEVSRDETYRAMHQDVFAGNLSALCSGDEAMDVLRLIEAAERSAKLRTWIGR